MHQKKIISFVLKIWPSYWEPIYASYKQIFESYRENFQSISNWFEQKFSQTFWVLLRKSLMSFKLVRTKIPTNFWVLPRKYPIRFKLVWTEIQFPINFPKFFPSIQWISHAYFQCDRETSDEIRRMIDWRLSTTNGGRSVFLLCIDLKYYKSSNILSPTC